MATAPTPLEQVRAIYSALSMEDQLSILCDLIDAAHIGIKRSTALADALIPVGKAFEEAFAEADAAANPWECAA